LKFANACIVTSEYSVWRLVRDAKLSFKKTLVAAEQDRPDVARKRRFWKTYQGKLAPERLSLSTRPGLKST
jgi:hypothetical protein